MQSRHHTTVLLHEAVDMLQLQPGMTIFEGTLGNAGHTREICHIIGSEGTIIATDLDQQALQTARERLSTDTCHARCILIQDNFRNADRILAEQGIARGELHGALFDLGLRTEQIYDSHRGFSFQFPDEPLSMTFSSDPSIVTAYVVLNEWDERLIADILYSFGDERRSRKIARAIAEHRAIKPLETVGDLLNILEPLVGGKRFGKTHPATKIFQAIRIAVNDEYGAIEEALTAVHDHLAPGGRISVISFHSGEDRVVKRWIKNRQIEQDIAVVTKKPLTPSNDEIAQNPHARSSKLRVWEKL